LQMNPIPAQYGTIIFCRDPKHDWSTFKLLIR
jgi:hypothetical protein